MGIPPSIRNSTGREFVSRVQVVEVNRVVVTSKDGLQKQVFIVRYILQMSKWTKYAWAIRGREELRWGNSR